MVNMHRITVLIQMFTYVYDVLVPEVVIRLVMESRSVGYSDVRGKILTKVVHNIFS